jgi:colanic acid biosynthesis protein WcaH
MATPKEEYLTVIKNTQLIALDLIIVNEKNEILLGYRNNEPAKNTWFTFGSRVYKTETFEEACERISKNEVGTTIKLGNCKKVGVYKHNYNNNFENNDFGTNYVVFAYEYKCKEKELLIKGDDQHSIYSWFTVPEIMAIEGVHQYVKNYFVENPSNKIW